VLAEGGFELVMADNSYGRVDEGSLVVLDGDAIRVRGRAVLDDGTCEVVRAELTMEGDPWLGRRDPENGRMVKGRTGCGDYLLYRGLPGYRMEQIVRTPREMLERPLSPPRSDT
jgi:hypothetical protein